MENVSYYIGQTGRSFQVHYHEHIKALKTVPIISKYAQHMDLYIITVHLAISRIYTLTNSVRKRDCLKTYKSYKSIKKELTCVLNSQLNSGANPIFEEILLREEQLK